MVVKEKKDINDFVDKQYELVPPDGGWGYLVAIAAVTNFVTMTGFTGCFGMMYNDFLIEKSMGSATMTTMAGVYCMSGALAAFLAAPLLTIVSFRKLAFIATVISSCGTLGTAVMMSPFMFFLFAGGMQGIGLGVLYNLSCTIMNDYFLERRTLIMNFVQTATGVIAMVVPMFVKWSLDQYGSKGTLLLIGGIMLHSLPAVLLMQPVQWHMKKVEVTGKAEQELLLVENVAAMKESTPVIKLTDLENFNINENTEKALEFTENDEKKSGIRKFLQSLIDPSLLKTLVSWATVGPAVCNFTDGTFSLILPQYLYSMEWSQENVAVAISLYGFGDLTLRVIFTLVSRWMIKLGISRLYIAGIFLAAFSRCGMLWSSNVTTTMVFLTLAGSSHCSVAVLTPLVISEAVSPEKFTSALGICLLLNGILSITLGPAVGAVRDLTNRYSVVFYAVISFYTIVAVLWLIQMVIKNNKQRSKIVKTNSISSHFNKVSS